ncbi:hypothetical protein GF407_08710 [candidate division KSB1 bacterium]|nr:hypothetical protein [candidate division KSB1 bacterium]
MKTILLCLLLCLTTFFSCADSADEFVAGQKQQSVFWNRDIMETALRNCEDDAHAASIQRQCIELAEPWKTISDDSLWSMMFGPNISRSWMVWSDGFCPNCQESVTMYHWKIEPERHPWKVQCPHCNELFPKNDFYAFYKTGLDSSGVFDPDLADRSLLFNVSHPDSADPLHRYGVDDGEGFFDGKHRWRFIGAYLVYGQWKHLILQGIRRLSAAYAITGDPLYAHKAAILLDRIADLYPSFDYRTQGYTYEQQNPVSGWGYVSVWHDACEETRELILAYDMIFDAIKQDSALVHFLSEKARQYHLSNKESFADIQKNIENGILIEVLKNRHKIVSNFPRREAALILTKTILGWPHAKDRVMTEIDQMLSRATVADGLSGEKGLAGYARITPTTLVQLLSVFSRLEGDFIETLFERVPELYQTFRFHIDLWFNQEYYPKIGDTGSIAEKTTTYAGADFYENSIDQSNRVYAFTSPYSLFWRIYQITGDADFVKIMYRANNHSVGGLPYDILKTNSQRFQQNVQAVIDSAGTAIATASVNKEKWCVAMMKSGQGGNARAIWLDYDIGGNHCHADGMNIGLFAEGLDLLPGFGYPPVQFGGWTSPRAIWYRKTAAHNTVVIDGNDQMIKTGVNLLTDLEKLLQPLKRHKAGKTELWGLGKTVQAIRVSGSNLWEENKPDQYERTLVLVDVSKTAAYVFDLFRVIGGRDHAKFMHGYFGDLKTEGLSREKMEPYGHETLMSEFYGDPHAEPGWRADWQVEDNYGYLSENQNVGLGYIDLTPDAEAAQAKTWVAFGFKGGETHIPSLIIRRRSDVAPLRSAFTGIIEPYNGEPAIKAARRLPLLTADGTPYGEMNVAVVVALRDGRKDYIAAMDVQNAGGDSPAFGNASLLRFEEFETDAELFWGRKNKDQSLERVVICNGSYVKTGQNEIELNANYPLVEIAFKGKDFKVMSGDKNVIKSFR